MTTSRPRVFARPALAASLPLLLAVATAACSPGTPTGAPTGSPGAGTPNPTTSPTSTPVTGIAHPTGARDIVLRMEESGGFAPVDAFATYVPSFTLYGDGTVVFKDLTANPPDPVGNVTRLAPLRIVKLGEDGVQALLQDALVKGGLGIAVGPYMGMGADIPTTTFTVNADGGTKQVSVSGFLPDLHPQDAVIVAQLSKLAEELGGFGELIGGEGAYTPSGFRGVLQPIDQAFGPVVDWPWTDLAPADFGGGENDFVKTAVLTPAQVAAMAIPGVDGGMMGLNIKKDDKLYSFALRPLLPDESK